MTEELGLTAQFPESSVAAGMENKIHPAKLLYQDIKQNQEEDFLSCQLKLQCHKCSAFCMRRRHIL
jgi:hypothetical protein